MNRKKVSTTVYLETEQMERLKALHDKTRVPVAEFVRQGVDLILAKYESNIPGQLALIPDLPYPPEQRRGK